ncbi:hypothetical protein [Sandarakinorhabdus oryzae]|uniref:hypothetical protein n=1 Tax=Sandarakinorhabdus oryzae TaxID=2675220 RepID=UPI0012E1A995|nr:hypothetical protein [Sandarakinorhabdus oryzae]
MLASRGPCWTNFMCDASSAPAMAGDTSLAVELAAPAPARKSRDYSSERQRVRYRPGTREARRLVGSKKDRMLFLEQLARHGDPAIVADQMGLPLLVLLRQRDADPAFAAEWRAAVNYAWERVECRVLAFLLGQGGDDEAKRAGPIDTRLVLAILTRRDRPVVHGGATRPLEGASVERMRAELRALAGMSGG